MSERVKVALFWFVFTLVIVGTIFGVANVLSSNSDEERARCVAAGGVWKTFYHRDSICFDKNAVIKL